MRRTPWVLVAVISAAALLSGCGDSVGPAAAKVGSTTISRTTLDDELTTITDNPVWVQSVSQSLKIDIAPTNGGVSTQLSARWLTLLVNQAIADQVFEQKDLTVTAKDRAAAKATLLGTFGNQATFKKLPKSFRDKLLARQARFEAVKVTVPPPAPTTDADLEPLVDSVRGQLCPGGVTISHIQLATQAEADAVLTELAQGADFATLAAERSADTGSGPAGGLVACTDSGNFADLPEAFRTAASQLAPGAISQPVQTPDGWHIIKVGTWNLETARGVLKNIYEGNQPDPMTKFLNDRLLKKKVWVDPRYGTVLRSKTSVQITPPLPLEVRTDPEEPTTTTTAFGATGQ